MSGKSAEVASLVASVLNLPAAEVNADAAMENLPQWDSLAQLNICLAFQERFGVAMDMETIASSTSVAKLAALLPN
ncbi:MAG: acyl carrier protein [Acidobacteriaceae bacterium]